MKHFVAAIFLAFAVFSMPALSNTTTTATPVTLNGTTSLSLTSISDINYVSFTLPADGYVTVNLNHEIMNSGSNTWAVSVINTSNQSLLSFAATYANTDTSASVGLAAGTYYVKVMFGDSCSYCNTSLINQQFRIGVNYTAGSGYEKAPNNVTATATSMTLNTDYTGSLKSIADYNYYKFTLSSDGYVTTSFSHPIINTANNSWAVSIIDQSNQPVLSYTATYDKNSSSSIGLPAGTYYLKVVFTDTCTYCSTTLVNQPFTVSTSFAAGTTYEKKPNATAATATPIRFNTAYTGALLSRSDFAYFKFVLTASANITSTFNHRILNSTNNKWVMTVLNAQNTSMLSFMSDYSQQAVSKSVSLPAGTYYVKVVFNDTCYYCDSTLVLEPFSVTISTNDVATSDADRVFNWAESVYPTMFPKGPPTQFAVNYQYRYYATTNLSIAGTRDGKLVVDGGEWNGLTIGKVSDFLPFAVGAGF